MKASLGILIAAGLLVGCDVPAPSGAAPETVPASPETETPNRAALPTELPDELYALAFDLTMARTLAEECGETLAMNEGLTNTVIQETVRDLSAQGYTTFDLQKLRASLPEAQLAADEALYLQSNGITSGDAASYCAAGEREVAARSGIGRFLAVSG